MEIRPLTTLPDMQQAEAVQRQAWQIDDLEIINVHTLHALQHNGAALLGAFDGDRLVGFCLGVLGTQPAPQQPAATRLKLYSVMAGVLPAYQGQGVGRQLKAAQREFALRIGVPLITWTYDPLESRNAHFNLARLGAVCGTYHVHFHGELGGINAGLPTDRFEVAWWLASDRVRRRMDGERRPFTRQHWLQSGARLLNEAAFDVRGLPAPPDDVAGGTADVLLVEIPADFQAVKRQDVALARRWRAHTRAHFTQLFAAGYLATDFISEPGQAGPARSFYVLTRASFDADERLAPD
ncbi:MAG: GNAT family N-acetyltransferase [Anaerolineales bacterium]|nr:GNAT family N-acetyltransferase [Anaerolineales bacterium]